MDARASLPSASLDAMMVHTATVSGTPPSTKYCHFLCLTASIMTMYAEYVRNIPHQYLFSKVNKLTLQTKTYQCPVSALLLMFMPRFSSVVTPIMNCAYIGMFL